MPKLRLGLALLIPPPLGPEVNAEVDALRVNAEVDALRKAWATPALAGSPRISRWSGR